jgi:hypothetical protein
MRPAIAEHTLPAVRNHPKPDRLRARMEAAIEKLLTAAERLIAEFDALEPDTDLEPYLAGDHGTGGDDREMEADAEYSLGWNATHSQVQLGESTEDGDLTAPESHGMGFQRCGPDDAEDGHDREATNEDGGNILDEGGHDEGWDSGIGDEEGREEQFGAFVGKGYTRTVPTIEGDEEVTFGQHADEVRATANNAARYARTDRKAADTMLDELRAKRGLFIGLRGDFHAIDANGGTYRVERLPC